MNENSPAYILLVEDDADIRGMLADLLTREGWKVLQARDAIEMNALLSLHQPDLAVLDINLPGEDGLSICKRLSADTDLSILMLTARSEDIDRIIGLEIGADDYMGKPFHPRELVARIKALLRRSSKQSKAFAASTSIQIAGLVIDIDGRNVHNQNGQALQLSGAEFELLCVLAEAKGRVLSRDFLLDRIHGRSANPFDRSIDVLVSRLRKKIDRGSQTLIESVRNSGYVLREPRQ
jgi:two-component system, OmpR family, response regulator